MRLIRATLIALILTALSIPSALAAEKTPTFNLEKMNGGRAKLADYLGKGPLLINFWATWCKPCKQEAPHLIKLFEKYKAQGLQVVAISVDNVSSVGKVKPAARKLGLSYPVLLDPQGQYSKRMSVAALPTNILVDKKGQSVRTFTGYRPGDEHEIEAEIKKLLSAAPGTDAQQ
ncbi:MAG: redoxin [Gemmatimonadetes bacterium]|nr:redoxin [Gemmatimonadota bacterium]